MFETYLFSDEWDKEEKENLMKKTVYYMERADLPSQIVKPHSLIYGKDGSCIGYTYFRPPYEMISLKEMFHQDNREQFLLNGNRLLKIAKNTLDLLEELSSKNIYPGLIDLSYLYVPVKQPDQTVLLFHPELFQAGTLPSSYPWYPSDAKLFDEELILFEKDTQQKADAKLIYKILTASSKGNVKIPPNQKNQSASWEYFQMFPQEWKDYFIGLGKKETSYEELKRLLCQSNKTNAEEQEPVKKEKAYAMITILRQAEKSAHDISRELYLLQEKIENHPNLDFWQGFVLGNKHPFGRGFRHYPKEFRSQLGHVISDYSFGEAIIVGVEMLEASLKMETHPSFFFLLLDGEIKNDKTFHIALKRLEKLQENWYTKLVLVPVEEFKGEGYHLLKNICMKGNK